MKQKLIYSLLVMVLIVSCKSREEIAREQMVDTLSIQMKDVQKINTETFSKIQQFEERVNGLTGQVEETDHQNKQSINTKVNDLNARITILESVNKTQNDKIKLLQDSQEASQQYIKEVLSSLKKISKSTKPKSLYEQAMFLYKKRKYNKAKPLLLNLSQSKKYKGNKKARILHNLGMIAYNQKNYDDALVYHSKLISTYPKSWYSRNGYLFMARSFHKQKKVSEAFASYNELIRIYPNTKQATQARKYLKELK